MTTFAYGTVTDFGYDDASRLALLEHNLTGTANDQTYGFAYTPASQLAQRSASNDSYAWQASTQNVAYREHTASWRLSFAF